MLKRLVKRVLPRPLLHEIRRYVLYGFEDVVDRLAGRREDMVPPKRMIYIGTFDFKKVGDEFMAYFRDLGRLSPDAEERRGRIGHERRRRGQRVDRAAPRAGIRNRPQCGREHLHIVEAGLRHGTAGDAPTMGESVDPGAVQRTCE